MWYDDNIVYFTCTSGGKKKLGQIWRINVTTNILELMFESNHSDTMKACDNITIAPWGDVIVCEDGRGRERIIGIKNDDSTNVEDFHKYSPYIRMYGARLSDSFKYALDWLENE